MDLIVKVIIGAILFGLVITMSYPANQGINSLTGQNIPYLGGSPTINTQPVQNNTNTTPEVVNTTIETPINCNYILIAETKTTNIPPNIYKKYTEYISTGKYKFEWNFLKEVKVDVFNMINGNLDSFSNMNGNYEFRTDKDDYFGIKVLNRNTETSTGYVKFYKWICEGEITPVSKIFETYFEGWSPPE